MSATRTSPARVLARVDDELRAFWASPGAPGETPRARACTMNLVVVAAAPAVAEQWVPVVDEVLLSVPARAIVAGLDPDGADSLEADATAVCTPSTGGGPAVCSERVTLSARGAVCARLASCVGALAVPDVPTTLVWLGRVHAEDPAFAPLARDASRIVLDASVGSLSSLAHVVYWSRTRAASDRPGVADLTWTRIAPWQELCARMFDEPRVRSLAWGVTRIALTQASPAGAGLGTEGALLLGWLATRLGWKAASLAGKLRLLRPDERPVHAQLCAQPDARLPPGALLAAEIEASAGDITVRGEVRRTTDEMGEAAGEAMARWRLAVTCGAQTSRLEQRVRLRDSEPARLLERTLHRPPHDPALVDAVAWADELRGEELSCG
jgi:glucose-6-phosphate dehydrogenase assembly protein OpcA